MIIYILNDTSDNTYIQWCCITVVNISLLKSNSVSECYCQLVGRYVDKWVSMKYVGTAADIGQARGKREDG